MRQLILTLFFFSGAFGLVYQVVWVRMLTQVFGTTAVAVGVVLAAFMSGLALGSWLLGRAADRSVRPLGFYALLELGIGLSALAVHLLLDRIAPAYPALYELAGGSEAALTLVRFVLAFGLVTIPTFLMGATLPVLARAVVRRVSAAGADLGGLYAANTAGAVAGAMAGGFYLIGALGVHATVYVAVAGNLLLGLVAAAASRRSAAPARAPGPAPGRRPRPVPGPPSEPLSPWGYALLLLGLGVSGMTSFAYEIYWARSLVFLLGNSTYAVTTMLTAFIAGIGLGAWLASAVVDRVHDRLALFGWTQLLIAVSAAAALPLLFAFIEPETIRRFLDRSADQVLLLTFARFGVAMLVMLVPATLIGMTFPLVARIGIADLGETGRRVGLIYASNTFGNVIGALLPGLVLLGWLGIQRGILLMAGLNALVGLAFLVARMPRSRRLRWAVPAAAALAAPALAAVPLDFRFPSEGEEPDHRVLFYEDGPSATTKVTFDPETGDKVMAIDGVVIGGTTFTEYKQLLLAHLPKLLLEDVSTELSVGLGSGMLAGESIRHPGVEEITCVEIEPSVVAGAALFAEENHGVLSHPRVRLVVDDVISFLRTTEERYRVISADEKTAVDYASNGLSYSREYYRLLRQHLEPGGILIQWVPGHLPPGQYAMVLRTFAESFPEVLVAHFMPALDSNSYNTLLIGSEQAVRLDTARMQQAMDASPETFAALERYGLSSPGAYLSQLVADGQTLRRVLGEGPVNTLDHPRYEFFSPWDYAEPLERRVVENLRLLSRLRAGAVPSLLDRIEVAGAQERGRLRRAAAAEEVYLAGYRSSLREGPVSAEDLFRRYDKALDLASWNDSLRARIFLHYSEIADSQRRAWVRADLMRRALEVYDRSAKGHLDYSRALQDLGRSEDALRQALEAVERDPNLPAARRHLARLLVQAGRRAEARGHLAALRELTEPRQGP